MPASHEMAPTDAQRVAILRAELAELTARLEELAHEHEAQLAQQYSTLAMQIEVLTTEKAALTERLEEASETQRRPWRR